MSILDILIFLTIVYHALRGFQKGLTAIVCDIAALCASIFVGLYYYAPVASKLEQYASVSSTYSDILAFGLIWVFIVVVMRGVSLVVTHAISVLSLGLMNRLLGMGLSTVKALLLLMPLLLLLAKYNPNLIQQSQLAAPVFPVVLYIKREFVDPHLDDVQAFLAIPPHLDGTQAREVQPHSSGEYDGL